MKLWLIECKIQSEREATVVFVHGPPCKDKVGGLTGWWGKERKGRTREGLWQGSSIHHIHLEREEERGDRTASIVVY